MDTGSVLGRLGVKALPSTAIAFALIFLAACGGPAPTGVVTPPTATSQVSSPPTESRPSPTPMPTPTPSAADLLLDAATAEGQLNVIALPRDWMNYGEIIDTFSRKYGIRVHEIQPNAGSLEEIEALREARRTGSQDSPDVIDVGLSFAVQAKDENLLQPYLVSTWNTIPDNMKDAQGYWYGDYYGVIAFEVNADLVEDMPSDWSDLLKPGNIVALGGLPLESYMARMGVYAASLANGGSLDDVIPGLRFFQQVNNAGNLSRVAASRDTVASGETPIAIRWDYLALSDRVVEAGEHNIKVVIPKTGLLAGLYAQAISAYAPHPNTAKLWMEFLYSDEGQQLWLKGYGRPVRITEMSARGAIPSDVLQFVPPLDAYMGAAFPTSVQLNQADKAILAAWTIYVR